MGEKQYGIDEKRLAEYAAQIKEIQYTLDNCEVVDDDSISLDEVGLGSTIKLKNFQSGKVETWQIVSSNEANFAEHKISDDWKSCPQEKGRRNISGICTSWHIAL